jgi:hypothetical protein
MKRAVLALAIAALPMAVLAEERAWDLLKEKQFRSAYYATLGAKRSEKWIAKLFGPSQQTTHEVVGQIEYVFADSCKPHYCDTDNLVIAYAPAGKAVFVKLVEEGNATWLGNPSPEVKAQLESHYVRRFRP